MKTSVIASCFIFFFPLVTHAVSLLEALRQNGATSFADEIEASPDSLALFTSPDVQTVYAIPDLAYSSTNNTLRARQDDPKKRENQATGKLSKMGDIGDPPGKVEDTKADEKVVSETDVETSTDKLRRQFVNGTVPTIPVKLASGLGSKVNILRGDIEYDGGVIHMVDGFFTFAESLTNTIKATNLTGIESLLAQANLTDTFSNIPNATIFTPSNEAIAEARANGNNSTLSGVGLTTLLQNHIIAGFAGYLPLLTDGATYTTLAGSTVKVSIVNKKYFINGVQITSPNAITDNGVAHTINGILYPTPQEFPGAGWMLRPSFMTVLAIASTVIGQLVF